MQGLIKGVRDLIKTWIWDQMWPTISRRWQTEAICLLGQVPEYWPQPWQFTGCSVINLWASNLLDLFPSSWFLALVVWGKVGLPWCSMCWGSRHGTSIGGWHKLPSVCSHFMKCGCSGAGQGVSRKPSLLYSHPRMEVFTMGFCN